MCDAREEKGRREGEGASEGEGGVVGLFLCSLLLFFGQVDQDVGVGETHNGGGRRVLLQPEAEEECMGNA